MRSLIGLSVLFLALLMSSCKNADSKVDTSAFDAAYPAMYSDLNLPEYRRGTLTRTSTTDEGLKTVHTIVIDSDDNPEYVREFYHPNIIKLGWRDLESGKRLTTIDKSDLYFTKYVKGKNKIDINSSARPQGGSKTKIVLSVFQ